MYFRDWITLFLEVTWTCKVSFILLLLAGFFNGHMDSLRFHWRESFFNHPRFSEDFWNPDMSWHNKYKERGHTWLANFIEEIDNTALVFLTDGWHMMQWLMITSVALSIVLVNPIALGTWQSTLALAIVFRFVPFHIGFFISYYLMRRKEQ